MAFWPILRRALFSQFYPRDLNGAGFTQGYCRHHSCGKVCHALESQWKLYDLGGSSKLNTARPSLSLHTQHLLKGQPSGSISQ